MDTLAYKILTPLQWQAFQELGNFSGSPDDQRDGYIHLSTANQIVGTLDKHFAGQSELFILEFDTADLKPNLKWEPSRNGELFPHFYGVLQIAWVRNVRESDSL